MKRIIGLSDMHCGHITGIVPPEYMIDKKLSPSIHDHQKEVWSKLSIIANTHNKLRSNGTIKKLIVVCNGDAIQGKKHEGWIGSYEIQVEMAIKALSLFHADQYVFTRGTPAHTGKDEDYENFIAKHFDASIRNEQYLTCQGKKKSLRFYFRHNVGRSVLPHGKFTPLARKAVEAVMKGMEGSTPKPSILGFGHVHYFARVDDVNYTAYAMPALQTNTEFGQKMCEGIVHWGVLWWDESNGELVGEGRSIEVIETSKPEEIFI